MDYHVNLRLALAQRQIPGGHYMSKKELYQLAAEQAPLTSSPNSPILKPLAGTEPATNPEVISYIADIGLHRYLDMITTTDRPKEDLSIRLHRMPINTDAAITRLDHYERFDSGRIMPHQWMPGLGFIKALSKLDLFKNPKIKSELKRFKIEFAAADKRDHLVRTEQVKRLSKYIVDETLTALDVRQITNLIDDASDPEQQETAVLMLFLGIVYSDAIKISDMNPTGADALLNSLGNYLKAQDFTNEILLELNEDAETHFNNFINMAAYRTMLEIKRKFETPHNPKAKLIYQMNEKLTLIAALSFLYNDEDQFHNLQKLMHTYGLQTHDLQESIFAAYFLHEAGQQDLCQDLILSKVDEVLLNFFNETMMNQVQKTPPTSNFMEDLVGHPFFAILNSFDPDFAFVVFEEHIAKLRLFEKSDSTYLPADLRPADENVFVPLMDVFSDERVLKLCHDFLMSEHTTTDWKLEVLDFYDRVNNKGFIAQSLIDYLQTLSSDTVLEDDTIYPYQAAVEIMTRIIKKSDHLRLIAGPEEDAPNFFFNLGKVAKDRAATVQVAFNTLRNSKSLDLRKQALSYLTQTSKDSAQRTEILQVALECSLDDARTDMSYSAFVLGLIEAIVEHPKSDTKVLFGNLLSRQNQSPDPKTITHANSTVINAALERALLAITT